MNLYSLITTLSYSLILSLLAFGVYFSFRILKFPDLTVDGSFPLGAAITGFLISQSFNPLLSLILSILAGGIAGLIVGLINTKMKIPAVVSSILVMSGLFSINLYILGKPNLSFFENETIFSKFSNYYIKCFGQSQYANQYSSILLLTFIIISILIILSRFLNTYSGLKLQVAGDGTKAGIYQGINTVFWLNTGLCIANALYAFSGSLFAQYQTFADINMGFGSVIIGLASVFTAQALEQIFVKKKNIFLSISFVFVGTFIYRYALSIVLSIGFDRTFTNLLTSFFVLIAILFPSVQTDLKTVFKKR